MSTSTYFMIRKDGVTPSNHRVSYNPLAYLIDSLIQVLKKG